MNIWITGPRGFVGSRLMKQYPHAVGAPSLRNFTEEQMKRLLEEVQPDVIVHTAAISHIPDCDRDPEGSYRANVELPLMIARCNPGAKLICFSSDQVYSGCSEPGPYREDTVCPGNLYAREKVEMEQRVLELDPDAVMLRAEWMYDFVAPKGNYFLNMLAATGTVSCSSREYRGVTYIREVAEAMDAVMKLPGGAYNFGSETKQSMYELTRDFLRMVGKDNPMTEASGKHNLWMDCGKAAKYGVRFSDAQQALKKCYRDFRETEK